MILFLKFLLKCASKSSFFRFGVEIRFWSCKIAAICGAVVRSSIVFCNSVSADRNRMAASRLLLAAAACVILLRFAAKSRKSHCNGSVRRVKGALGTVFFLDFGTNDFIFKIPFKMRLKIVVFPLASRSGFGAVKSQQFVEPLCVVLLCFVTQCLQIAMEWLRQGCSLRQLHA